MNIVPKYLYLCQCLPLFLSKSFLRKIDSVLSAYVWEGTKSHIGLSIHTATGASLK